MKYQQVYFHALLTIKKRLRDEKNNYENGKDSLVYGNGVIDALEWCINILEQEKGLQYRLSKVQETLDKLSNKKITK